MKTLFLIFFFIFNQIAFANTAVVVSSPYLQDIVSQVSCTKIKSKSILPLDTDPHTYYPTPRDVLAMSQSKNFIFISYELEHWLLKNKPTSQSLEVAKDLPLKKVSLSEYDLHIWQSPELTKLVAQKIYSFLKLQDEKCLKNFLSSIDETSANLKKEINAIPKKSRILATGHDAFGYFADFLGLQQMSILGSSTERTNTPKALHKAITKLKEQGVKSIFLENNSSSRAITTVAKTAGIKVGGELYADGPGSKAPTILEMWKANTKTIVRGLK